MVLKDNTICITGGSSGIGLELAKRLVEKENQVIICGRSVDKLEKAKKDIPGIITYPCDLSEVDQCKTFASWIAENYPACNILVNNAAIVNITNFYEDENMVEKADAEIRTNLMAPIALTKYLLPIIEKNKNPAVINHTTGLVYAPKAAYPIYNASKAALHSFTQVLRFQLKNEPISVIEVLFPAVDTPWHKGNPPKIAIGVEIAVQEMIKELERDKLEIKIGKVGLLYNLSRIAPAFMMKKISAT